MRANNCIHKTAESTNESKQFYIKKTQLKLPKRANNSIHKTNESTNES